MVYNAVKAMGVTLHNANQFDTPSMKDFNQMCPDRDDVTVYSVGSYK